MRPAFAMQGGMCHVLDEDPDLGSRLTPADAIRARQVAITSTTRLEPGSWRPAAADPSVLGLLVLDGILARHAVVSGGHGVELLGSGDVLRPWDTDDGTTVAFAESWEVVTTARLALLDSAFHRATAPWPGIVAELLARCVSRSSALVRHRAIAQLPRLETRILLTLWAIGDRWGRVEPGGISLSLPITQRLLADLVSASRQGVNVALRELTRTGEVERRGDRLLLRRDALEARAQADPVATLVALTH